MWMKVVLAAATVLVAIQATSAANKEAVDTKIEKTGYYEIDGEIYYINNRIPMPRDDAETFCNTLNMTLITFPTLEKWEAVTDAIWPSAYDDNFYWTGAMKDEGSKVWYWNRSGVVIPFELLHWHRWEPTLSNNLIRTCINFINYYYDDGCEYSKNFVCEY